MLRIFCDYGAEWPLWEAGMQVPEDYGLSAALSARLSEWNQQFQEHMHWERGWNTGFDDKRWTLTGQRLAREVQREVGAGICVSYGP